MCIPHHRSIKIIDSHCHCGSGDQLKGPWDTRASLFVYLQRARDAGISASALIPALANDYRKGNREVAKLIKAVPSRFYGWLFINPVFDQGQIQSVVSVSTKHLGFIGIKVHHYNGGITREVCEAALANQVPIMWDVGGKLNSAEMVASEYPGLNIIIPHLGSFGDDWRAHRACLDVMSRFDNVYTDSSGIRRFDFLEEVIKRLGPSRLLFGSDGPWLHPGVELKKIRLLKLPPHQEYLVLAGNFLRLITRSKRIGSRPA